MSTQCAAIRLAVFAIIIQEQKLVHLQFNW